MLARQVHYQKAIISAPITALNSSLYIIDDQLKTALEFCFNVKYDLENSREDKTYISYFCAFCSFFLTMILIFVFPVYL